MFDEYINSTVEDTSVLGHFIPKDTTVMANIWAVHYDPKVWDKPEQFNPNRFLTSDGKQVLKNDALIPFSTGLLNNSFNVKIINLKNILCLY